MNTLSYPIEGWNPIVNQQGETVISITFKPDLKALELFNHSPANRVLATVFSSGTSIDGLRQFVTIDQSSQIPNLRENLFVGSGLYVVTLPREWKGYPLGGMGTITFQNEAMKGIIQELKMIPPPVLSSKGKVVAPLPKPTSTPLKSSMPKSQGIFRIVPPVMETFMDFKDTPQSLLTIGIIIGLGIMFYRYKK